jgi:hypothetical protein
MGKQLWMAKNLWKVMEKMMEIIWRTKEKICNTMWQKMVMIVEKRPVMDMRMKIVMASMMTEVVKMGKVLEVMEEIEVIKMMDGVATVVANAVMEVMEVLEVMEVKEMVNGTAAVAVDDGGMDKKMGEAVGLVERDSVLMC